MRRTGFEKLSAKGAQIVPFTEPADVYVVNTCTVTQMAAKKSRQILHRARRLTPDALIVATGCYVDGCAGEAPEGVDLMIGNQDKERLVEIVEEAALGRTLLETEQSEEESGSGHTRAFLKVQDGCRQFCSYCIIPYVRGPLVSKEPEEVVSEALRMAQEGYREIVLTGIHLSSYGRKGTLKDPERSETLGSLICSLNQIDGIDRIRLGSLEPGLVTGGVIWMRYGRRISCARIIICPCRAAAPEH